MVHLVLLREVLELYSRPPVQEEQVVVLVLLREALHLLGLLPRHLVHSGHLHLPILLHRQVALLHPLEPLQGVGFLRAVQRYHQQRVLLEVLQQELALLMSPFELESFRVNQLAEQLPLLLVLGFLHQVQEVLVVVLEEALLHQ